MIPVEIKCPEHPNSKATLVYAKRGDNDQRTAVYWCGEDGGHYISVPIEQG